MDASEGRESSLLFCDWGSTLLCICQVYLYACFNVFSESYTYEVVSATITNNNIPGTSLDCSIGKKCMIDFQHAGDAWLEVTFVLKALRAQEGNTAGLITTHCESSVDKLGTIEIDRVRKAWNKADVAAGEEITFKAWVYFMKYDVDPIYAKVRVVEYFLCSRKKSMLCSGSQCGFYLAFCLYQ